MNWIEAREENILDFIIRDYIRTAAPVSSGKIYNTGIFRLSPATIRNAMLELDDEGFLEQPHTSSGRVPTDKAYRYFVDHLMTFRAPLKRDRVLLDELIHDVRERRELLFRDFARILSSELGLFTGVASFNGRRKVESFGLERVFLEPEFDDRNLTVEFSRLVDNLEKVAETFAGGSSALEPEVFIGEENPLDTAKEFSSVVMRFSDHEFGTCVVFSLGPKRMNYERVASFISFVIKDIEN